MPSSFPDYGAGLFKPALAGSNKTLVPVEYHSGGQETGDYPHKSRF